MNLPPHVHLSEEMLASVAAQVGASPRSVRRLGDAGIVNAVYRNSSIADARTPASGPISWSSATNYGSSSARSSGRAGGLLIV